MHAAHIFGGNSRVAVAAGLGNIRLVSRALRILVAQDVMRSMAALAVSRHQQPLLAQRKAVDGVDVHRIDVGQAMLLRHRIVAVAGAAGARNVERIDRRPRIVLGKDGVGVSMATGAGMLGLVGMHASGQPRRLIGVAGLALDRRDLIRMRILLDRRVAIAALQAAVDAGVKGMRIHADAVPRGVLHARIRVAGQAIAVRLRLARAAPPEAQNATRASAMKEAVFI